MTIAAMLGQILRREGGYVDHPADRGGPTNFGITQATLAAWRGGTVTAADVSTLTENEARSIYTKRYWHDPGFDRVPGEDLQALLFDAAVNHGPKQAVRLLQAAVGVEQDGVIGPDTLAAVPRMDQRRVAIRVIAARIRLFGRIISNDHSQAVFAAGWANRIAELIEGAL